MSAPVAQTAFEREPAGGGEFRGADAALRDGRVVHLRSIRASDEAEVVQAFERLSPDARYMRFMRVVKAPDLERLRKTLAAFPCGGDTIIATVPAADGIDIVGSAVLVLASNAPYGEFALSVAAEYGAVGLGGTLMTTLIDTAKVRGLEEIEGFVLAENAPMLRLAERLGFSVAPDPDDRAVRICRLRLGSP